MLKYETCQVVKDWQVFFYQSQFSKKLKTKNSHSDFWKKRNFVPKKAKKNARKQSFNS